MERLRCMLSDVPVDLAKEADTGALVVVQNNHVIGIIREVSQKGIKTIRMTFTRATEADPFTPLQGQGIEVFQDEREF